MQIVSRPTQVRHRAYRAAMLPLRVAAQLYVEEMEVVREGCHPRTCPSTETLDLVPSVGFWGGSRGPRGVCVLTGFDGFDRGPAAPPGFDGI